MDFGLQINILISDQAAPTEVLGIPAASKIPAHAVGRTPQTEPAAPYERQVGCYSGWSARS